MKFSREGNLLLLCFCSLSHCDRTRLNGLWSRSVTSLGETLVSHDAVTRHWCMVNKHMCSPFLGDREGPFCLTHWWARASRKRSVMSQWGETRGVLQLPNVNIKRELQISVKWNGSIVVDREVKLPWSLLYLCLIHKLHLHHCEFPFITDCFSVCWFYWFDLLKCQLPVTSSSDIHLTFDCKFKIKCIDYFLLHYVKCLFCVYKS